jgi:hypothetical protein
MSEKGISSEVSDFDLEHYCQGNPVNCYFFRMLKDEKTDKPWKKSIDKRADSLQQPYRIRKLIGIRHATT